ncbi:hypothetical protein [Bathymodiolus thermophilus thioautotrophic gill symbiont]|uniref:hypothetical protein n=1 Tax=Bathymodiolus thermophilus thioautotrophic gill symbiont TaxID=2360 RepID=UPI0013DFA8DA|nr:hypothetical protein [Bathymodiolus thermophilus thioautotrophic gill symbiont]
MNHQESTFYPFGNFSSDTQQSSRGANPALILLGQSLKKLPIGQTLNVANHLYLCKGL